MTPGSDVERRLELVEEYVNRMDSEVGGSIEGETGSGEPVEGRECHHGDHTYLALTTPQWEFVNLRYGFNGDEAWHIRHSTSKLSEAGQVEVTQEDILSAREELEDELNGQPPGEKRELRLNLMQILSREGCSVEFDTTEPLNIHGFNIDKKVFVSDDNFGVQNFEYAVQTIINLGWVGKDFLIENYGLRRGLD